MDVEQVLATALAERGVEVERGTELVRVRDGPGGVRAVLQITGLVWSSRVTVQHRLASRFRRGRLFLAGEAAHAYSPATGQGLNAAIQDAANLGWKLAFADGDGPLLDSYDRERRPVARRLLALTHLVFWAEAATGMIPSALRGRLAPLAAPLVPALAGSPRLVVDPGGMLLADAESGRLEGARSGFYMLRP